MSATSAAPHEIGLDDLPDAVVVVDGSGRIRHVNRAAARLVGVDAGLLVGEDAAARLPLADTAGRDWWACVRPLDADPTVAVRIPETDLTLFPGDLPDGRARPVTLTAARRGRQPGADLVVGLRRADHRRRAAQLEAELVAALSHDLRAPLTTVKGFAKTLLNREDRLTADQRREMLAAIVTDADRLNRLIGEVVDALRLRAGRLALSRTATDAGDLAQRALAGLPDDLRGRVRHPPGDGSVPLHVDAPRIGAVLSAMLSAALTGDGPVEFATERLGAALRLRISAAQAKPPAAPEQLFARTLAADRDAIRRWVARGVAEAHGGHITAAATPEGGLTVVLTLPLDRPKAAG